MDVDIVVKEVFRKGCELIGIEIHEQKRRKGMRNNEEGVGRGNDSRFLRLVKVD